MVEWGLKSCKLLDWLCLKIFCFSLIVYKFYRAFGRVRCFVFTLVPAPASLLDILQGSQEGERTARAKTP